MNLLSSPSAVEAECPPTRIVVSTAAVAIGPRPQSVCELSDAELRRHITDTRFLMRLAQARLRGSHSPNDALEARQWEAAMHEAIKARQQLTGDDELTFSGYWTEDFAKMRQRSGGLA